MSSCPPFKRPLFWLGLLLGGLASFGARRPRQPTRSSILGPLFDFVSDAVVVTDASGTLTDMNAAARALFGPDGAGLTHLLYPSGQPMPPGQSPLVRALRSGTAVDGAGCLYLSSDGGTRALDVRVSPLPGSGVAAVTRDVTETKEGETREAKAQQREQTLRALCRRLDAAPNAEDPAPALVEGALALAAGLADVRARLYSYDGDAKRITRLSSAPDDRPKRPKSQQQSQRPTFPFDASSPLLWSVYVQRQPAVGDDLEGFAYAVPLLAGGTAVGHLSLACPAAEAFADGRLSEALSLLAAIAVLALAGQSQAAQASALAAETKATQAVLRAVAERRERDSLADVVSGEVCRVAEAEVCTLALREADGLRLAGTAYRDALLFPDRHAPDNPALIGDAAREVMKKAKTVRRVGLKNPSFEAGVWRAFAGQSGRHSILSVPLAAGQGAITAYVAGDAAFPDARVRFLETLAALVSLALPGASPPAGRSGA